MLAAAEADRDKWSIGCDIVVRLSFRRSDSLDRYCRKMEPPDLLHAPSDGSLAGFEIERSDQAAQQHHPLLSPRGHRSSRGAPPAVLRAYARRPEPGDRMSLACFVPGLSTRKVGEALLRILGRPVSPATVSLLPK